MKIFVPALALACTVFGAGAHGQAYDAAAIVKHFAPEPDLGAPRALCIGTDSECAKAVPAKRAAPTNFDLVVNFEYKSTTLTKAARANLDEFAKALKDPRLGRASFVVEGHTDGQGGDSYNLDLSTRRANAVVSYLKDQGVDASKLESRGYGKLRPLAGDALSPGNRRVETRLRTAE